MTETWSLERKYGNNTGNDLWTDLIDLVRKTFPGSKIQNWRDEDGEMSLWWSQEGESTDFADKVMATLDEFVETHVLPYKVPTLVNLVCKSLVDRPSFATAIMEFQHKHGYHKTDSTLYTYFHDILGS